jgi:hypothetical protein
VPIITVRRYFFNDFRLFLFITIAARALPWRCRLSRGAIGLQTGALRRGLARRLCPVLSHLSHSLPFVALLLRSFYIRAAAAAAAAAAPRPLAFSLLDGWAPDGLLPSPVSLPPRTRAGPCVRAHATGADCRRLLAAGRWPPVRDCTTQPAQTLACAAGP